MLFSCSLCAGASQRLAVGCVLVIHSHDDRCVHVVHCHDDRRVVLCTSSLSAGAIHNTERLATGRMCTCCP